MIKAIYRIDDEGKYVDVYLGKIAENKYYDGEKWLEIDFEYVEIEPPNAKVVKWENGEWVIIEEYPKESQQPQLPNLEERLEALELAMLELILGGMG